VGKEKIILKSSLKNNNDRIIEKLIEKWEITNKENEDVELIDYIKSKKNSIFKA